MNPLQQLYPNRNAQRIGAVLGDLVSGNVGTPGLYEQVQEQQFRNEGLLQDARKKRGEAILSLGAADNYQRLHGSIGQSGLPQYLQDAAMVDTGDLVGAIAAANELTARQRSAQAALGGDWAAANAHQMFNANGPVELATVQQQNLIPNRFVPGGGGISTTEQGRASARRIFDAGQNGVHVIDLATGGAMPVGEGLPTPAPSYVDTGGLPLTPPTFGIAETDNYVRKILGNVGAIAPNATTEQIVSQIMPHLIQQESGGNPNAVSPKGARGLTQVMPATGRDPGFGVLPLQNDTPEENVRFGRDYLTAMVNRYPGRPDLALAAYNAGPGVADRFANSTAQRGGGRLVNAGGKSSQNAPSGYRFTATGDLEAIPGGPADKPEAPAKPLPGTALKLIQPELDAIDAASGMNEILDRSYQRIVNGELELGRMENWQSQARNWLGMNNESSRNYQSFVSDLNRARNESLRLNKGVQTEGDAQRAWDELIANPTDPEFVKQRIEEIKELNTRAILLRRQSIDLIRANYGHPPMDFETRNLPLGTLPPEAQPTPSAGWSIQRVE